MKHIDIRLMINATKLGRYVLFETFGVRIKSMLKESNIETIYFFRKYLTVSSLIDRIMTVMKQRVYVEGDIKQ